MFQPKGRCLIYNSTNLPKLSIIFPNLFHNISNTTWIAPSLDYRFPLMHVHISHQPYGQFLHCVHGNERIGTPDVVCDTSLPLRGILTFTWGKISYMHFLQTHSTPHVSRINIVLTKDGICTLVEVVVVNSTRTNLFPRSCTTQGFVVFNVAQAKKQSYCERHSIN